MIQEFRKKDYTSKKIIFIARLPDASPRLSPPPLRIKLHKTLAKNIQRQYIIIARGLIILLIKFFSATYLL